MALYWTAARAFEIIMVAAGAENSFTCTLQLTVVALEFH